MEGNAEKQDLGFKVFKLQDSNFKIWQTKIKTEEQLMEQLQQHLESLDENANIEDILYELLLKSGEVLTELEIKIIEQYPKLSIEEIKTLVVDKKWMATIALRIKTEMDAISHRLTERIKELADRYETPMPKLTNNIVGLTKKVESHLKKMDYVW